MDVPIDVVGTYVAVGVWAGLFGFGAKRKRWGLFIGAGIALLLFLNVRYFVEGVPAGVAFFIGLYDVLDNVGLADGESADALTTCVDNACSVWDRYEQHPSWGVAFYERFVNGPAWRTNLLYGHIGFNSIAFVLMHWQLWKPGSAAGSPSRTHRVVGRATFASVTVGTLCAVLLAGQHGGTSEYGGVLSTLGFWFMAFCVYTCAVMTVRTIRARDIAAHRRWTFLFAGSMWGAFWMFRVILFVLDPILRFQEALAFQIATWGAAPIGVAIAHQIFERKTAGTPPATEPETIELDEKVVASKV